MRTAQQLVLDQALLAAAGWSYIAARFPSDGIIGVIEAVKRG